MTTRGEYFQYTHFKMWILYQYSKFFHAKYQIFSENSCSQKLLLLVIYLKPYLGIGLTMVGVKAVGLGG